MLALANTNKQAIADALELLGKDFSKENTVSAAIKTIQGQIGTPNKEPVHSIHVCRYRERIERC